MTSLNKNAGGGFAVTLTDIELLTKTFADEHNHLAGIVGAMNAEFENTKRKYLGALRRAVGSTAKAKLTLHTAIAGSPQLFEKPRTQIFHGVKVGFQKGKGGIEFDDADKVVALIRKTFGDEAIAYIRTAETPDKKMLADLPVSELKKIGCTVADTGDVVVIKTTDSEIEKAVAALLKDAAEIGVAA